MKTFFFKFRLDLLVFRLLSPGDCTCWGQPEVRLGSTLSYGTDVTQPSVTGKTDMQPK